MNKRIIVIFIIILILLITASILAAFFLRPKNNETPVAESLPAKTESEKTPVTVDTDNDGLTNEQEKNYGTDSAKQDTDGDGFKDGDEVKNGYNPLKPAPGDKIIEESGNATEQASEEDKRRKVLNDMATMLENGNIKEAVAYVNRSSQDIYERKFSETSGTIPGSLKTLASTLRNAKFDMFLGDTQENVQYYTLMTPPDGTGREIKVTFSMRKEGQDWKVAGL